ncbi:hypothetical protein BB561_005619 [Smittium simulii]|uniref:Uncharacterized protein n=1 Tax=Smittium simulii TaxID=133385 RepID=A0A2T9Y9I2_9FUNG|nr:hypothetical protein BB561_005619 [Smittium simulii]
MDNIGLVEYSDSGESETEQLVQHKVPDNKQSSKKVSDTSHSKQAKVETPPSITEANELDIAKEGYVEDNADLTEHEKIVNYLNANSRQNEVAEDPSSSNNVDPDLQNVQLEPYKFPQEMYYDQIEKTRIQEEDKKSQMYTADKEKHPSHIEFISSGNTQAFQDEKQHRTVACNSYSTNDQVDAQEAFKRASQVAISISKSNSKQKRGRWDQANCN